MPITFTAHKLTKLSRRPPNQRHCTNLASLRRPPGRYAPLHRLHRPRRPQCDRRAQELSTSWHQPLLEVELRLQMPHRHRRPRRLQNRP